MFSCKDVKKGFLIISHLESPSSAQKMSAVFASFFCKFLVLEVEYVSAVWYLVSMLQWSGTVIWPFVLFGTSSSTEQHFPHCCFKCKHSFLGLLLILETKDFTNLNSPEKPGFIYCLCGGVKGKERPWLPKAFSICQKWQTRLSTRSSKLVFDVQLLLWVKTDLFRVSPAKSQKCLTFCSNGVTWVNRNQRRLKGLQIKKA